MKRILIVLAFLIIAPFMANFAHAANDYSAAYKAIRNANQTFNILKPQFEKFLEFASVFADNADAKESIPNLISALSKIKEMVTISINVLTPITENNPANKNHILSSPNFKLLDEAIIFSSLANKLISLCINKMEETGEITKQNISDLKSALYNINTTRDKLTQILSSKPVKFFERLEKFEDVILLTGSAATLEEYKTLLKAKAPICENQSDLIFESLGRIINNYLIQLQTPQLVYKNIIKDMLQPELTKAIENLNYEGFDKILYELYYVDENENPIDGEINIPMGLFNKSLGKIQSEENKLLNYVNDMKKELDNSEKIDLEAAAKKLEALAAATNKLHLLGKMGYLVYYNVYQRFADAISFSDYTRFVAVKLMLDHIRDGKFDRNKFNDARIIPHMEEFLAEYLKKREKDNK